MDEKFDKEKEETLIKELEKMKTGRLVDMLEETVDDPFMLYAIGKVLAVRQPFFNIVNTVSELAARLEALENKMRDHVHSNGRVFVSYRGD